MLRILFLFRGKVPKANREDSKSNKFTSLEDIFVTSSSQKRKAQKASKKSPRKKLKIEPTEPLAFSKANKQKGKVAIIAKANREVIIRKPQPKRKIKCLCHSKTPVKLIKALNLKKEPEGGVSSIL